MSESIHCPNCGAPAPFRGTAVSLVCEYCGSTVVRTDVDVKLVGQVSAIVDTGSPIVLNARGKLSGINFGIAGRLQVKYSRGTWNEWFLEFGDGTIGWLADALGSFSIVKPKSAGVLPPEFKTFHEINAGQEFVLDGMHLVVTDKRGAEYQGAEGILPFEAEPGFTFYGVDLRGYSGEFVTLDYGTDPNHTEPDPYFGRSVTLEEVDLRPLRRFEGWREPT